MVENRSSIFGIIALILGAGGVGLGAFSVVNFQVVDGPQGLPGEDGTDAPGEIVIGILDPDQGEVISGEVTIRALIAGSEQYTVSVLRNGTEIGTTLPMLWNTTLENDGWYNITIVATDVVSDNVNQDEVIVFVDSTPFTGQVIQVISTSTSLYDGGDYGSPHTYLSLTINTSKNSSIYISCSTTMSVMGGSGIAHIRLWLDNSTEVSVLGLFQGDPTLNLHLPITITGFYEGLSEGDHTIEFQGWIPGAEDLSFNWDSVTTLTVMEIGA